MNELTMQTPSRRVPVEIELPEFGIAAFISRHAPLFTMPVSRHEYHKFCYVESGLGQLEINGDTCELSSGCLSLVPLDVPHRFVDRSEMPLTLNMLCVSDSAFTAPISVSQLWSETKTQLPRSLVRSVPSQNEREELQSLFRSLVLELGQELPHRAASIFTLSVNILVTTARILNRPPRSGYANIPEKIADSLIQIDKRFNAELRVGDLAEAAGMSYRSYTGHFRKLTGKTVMQYITQRRMDFAKRRMLETGDIMGTAFEAGFQDLSHFYRVFKRQVGEPPQAYIERKKQEKNDEQPCGPGDL